MTLHRMSSVATEEMSSVAIEDISSVYTEDISSVLFFKKIMSKIRDAFEEN